MIITGDKVAYAQFWLGASYFGAIGDRTGGSTGLGLNVQKDLNGLGALGYKAIRVWATWDIPDPTTPSLLCVDGSLNQNALSRLQNLITYAKSKGINVDLTFSYGVFRNNFNCNINCSTTECATFNKYKTGIANATIALNNTAYSNVAFDVCNECGGSGLSYQQMAELTDTVRFWHPGRQVFLSFAAAPDTAASQYNSLGRQLDYVAPHFPRDCSSAWAINTGGRLNTFRSTLNPGYRTIPVYLQEENRRDYTGDGCDDGDSHPPITFGRIGNGYEVSLTDFDTASSQAKNNGANSAKAWNLHNEAGFNLSTNTMCRQFDSVEFNTVFTLACNRLGICLTPQCP
jgi:hypothetical protein